MDIHGPIMIALRTAFNSGRTKPIAYRKQQLQNFLRFFEENVPAILKALDSDLRKSSLEAITTEVQCAIGDIKHTLSCLQQWAKPDKPSKGLVNIMDEVQIMNDPYGTVLVIGAWNYPIQLTLMPVTAAIAAGNCVVIKPSELSPACAELIANLLPKYLDNECYRVILGGPQETSELLTHRFDYIFFTGSARIGRLVHAAANKYLTPTTLELGGKSPVYLDKSANLQVATRRILWGKFVNAGQTCIAPDYLLCTKEVGKRFIEAAKVVIKEWYGDNPKQSPDFCRIVNDSHFQRIVKLINKEKIVIGGATDASERFIEPTILDDVYTTDEIMQEEIFGPVLPIIYVEDPQQAIKYINSNEKPLSLYIFSENRKITDLILNSTSSGGVTVNDTLVHVVVESLPFGGVGGSGMGAYHGKYGFDTFVHKKSVLIKDLGKVGEHLSKVRYPPYSESKLNRMKKLMGLRLPEFPVSLVSFCSILFLGAVFSIAINRFAASQPDWTAASIALFTNFLSHVNYYCT